MSTENLMMPIMTSNTIALSQQFKSVADNSIIINEYDS